MKKIFLYGYLLIICLGVNGCNSEAGLHTDRIAVSILPIKYWVDRISGGDFQVTVVVPPGASPETYEPAPSQMKEVSRSYGYIEIGLIDFEYGLVRGIRENNPRLSVLSLKEGLDLLEGDCGHVHGDHPHHRHSTDPHIWMSPRRAQHMLVQLTDFLSEAKPDSAAKYRSNLNILLAETAAMDQHIDATLSPLNHRTVLIYHPFLTYFCDDYRLNQLPVEQEGKEPSVSQLMRLIATVKTQQIPVVFYQEQLHLQTVEALVRETGVRAVPVDPLDYDWLENIRKITAEIAKQQTDE